MTAFTTTERSLSRLDSVAATLARYGLVVVIAWIGALKFTAYEAQGIAPLVANSPLMSWVYDVFSVRTFSALLGVLEIAAALLIAVKPWWPRLSAAGSAVAIGLFVATLSFLVTTPGVFEASAGGFPVLSSTGQFLIKDVALLGVAVWTLADALRSSRP
ncbi:YkgB family protein [Mycobacterium sp. smrl_JER01]|uniref:YkgB family protein n=1 Tax=Mycobacterium sp. smrl_JER01 TaxID=3402633 RepID=UPI003AD38BAD